MQKWAHIGGTVALGVLGVASPQVQATASHHPIATVVGTVAWAIIGNLLPAPWAWFTKLLSK